MAWPVTQAMQAMSDPWTCRSSVPAVSFWSESGTARPGRCGNRTPRRRVPRQSQEGRPARPRARPGAHPEPTQGAPIAAGRGQAERRPARAMSEGRQRRDARDGRRQLQRQLNCLGKGVPVGELGTLPRQPPAEAARCVARLVPTSTNRGRPQEAQRPLRPARPRRSAEQVGLRGDKGAKREARPASVRHAVPARPPVD